MLKKVKTKSISDEISSLFTRKSLAESDSDEGELNLAESVEVEGETQVGDIHKRNAPLLEEISSRYKGVPSSRDLDSDSSDEEAVEESEIEAEDDLSEEETEASGVEEASSGEQESESIKIISQKTKESDLKGSCVKNQLKVWENLLEVRIRSQSLMTFSNRLPFPEVFKKCQEASGDFSSKASEVQESLTNVLNKLIETQNSLFATFPETRNSLKRGLYCPAVLEADDGDEDHSIKKPRLEFSANSSCDSFRKLYRSVIGKWSEKVNSSGNPLSQIDEVLARKDDLVGSSRLCRGNYDLFRDSDGEIDEESGKKTSPEIYDDTDFYHEILSELIEAKSSQDLGSIPASSSGKKPKNYVKKVVDTKASKGRRIRYVVHKKMVNFMAPNPHSSWTNEAKDELFSSIFGAGH